MAHMVSIVAWERRIAGRASTDPDDGEPVRPIMPHLYFWKSANDSSRRRQLLDALLLQRG
jgi:hypothetical protein